MSTKPEPKKEADKVVRNIRRQTRRKFSAEEKIRIVLAGIRGEQSIAELYRLSSPLYSYINHIAKALRL